MTLLLGVLSLLALTVRGEVAVGRLGDSVISSTSRDFIFGDLDDNRDGLISAEELKDVLSLRRILISG